MSEYAVYAIRYASIGERMSSENFIFNDAHDGPMPLDFFVWVVKNAERTLVIDTGFDAATAKRRGRIISRSVSDGLAAIGVDPLQVDDVVLTHLHYDHCGNHELFPRARYHLQEAEMQFCTGKCMCHDVLRHPYELDDVQAMVKRLFEGRVVFHNSASEIVPGVSVHWVGGHSQGLQVVRVKTKRGWVVLASDASHYYANFEKTQPFPVVVNVGDMLEGYNKMHQLATSARHIVPGHDPLVLQRYPSADKGDGIVRLDLAPVV